MMADTDILSIWLPPCRLKKKKLNQREKISTFYGGKNNDTTLAVGCCCWLQHIIILERKNKKGKETIRYDVSISRALVFFSDLRSKLCREDDEL